MELKAIKSLEEQAIRYGNGITESLGYPGILDVDIQTRRLSGGFITSQLVLLEMHAVCPGNDDPRVIRIRPVPDVGKKGQQRT